MKDHFRAADKSRSCRPKINQKDQGSERQIHTASKPNSCLPISSIRMTHDYKNWKANQKGNDVWKAKENQAVLLQTTTQNYVPSSANNKSFS